jgi:hypothetical protein
MICPSYSSRWLLAVSSTVGPAPLAGTAHGIGMIP